MLESLTIRRIALIDEVTIHFHEGMQVLTGETGAGKSIVVDSVNLILGGRAEKDMIRSGYEKGSVEAVFNVKENKNILQFMKEEEIDYDGQTVTVYREISSAGKNICRVCGVIIPVSRLKDLAVYLMDLHGQSEHQFLTDSDRQLAFLDQTGDEKHIKLMQETSEAYSQFIENHRSYARMVKQNQNREERMNSLERDLAELQKAKIQPGEVQILSEKRKKLAEAEKATEALNRIYEIICGDQEGGSCLSRVREATETMKSLAVHDPTAREISERFESLYFELEDMSYQISIRKQKSEPETGALEKTEDRLDLIHRLERKYGTDADHLLEVLNRTEEEYSSLSELEENITRMASEHKKLLNIYRSAARKLTESRHLLAACFEKNMMKELGELGMNQTRFQVAFKENDTGRPLMPTSLGDDRVDFMISPNPGEPLKLLSKTASGGELSRIMLAVKTLESANSGVESMVFDEIDTGISGRMAQIVAEKMIKISRKHQVICVTHLPQIAAAADFQYLVKKTVSEGRTLTSVTELNDQGRKEEVGRMISGADGINSEAYQYAAGMLRAASVQKQSES